jgi:hypothetical protein
VYILFKKIEKLRIYFKEGKIILKGDNLFIDESSTPRLILLPAASKATADPDGMIVYAGQKFKLLCPTEEDKKKTKKSVCVRANRNFNIKVLIL